MSVQNVRRAFTLIELLIVIGILLVVSGIAIINISEAQTRARVARVKADFKSFATAIEVYMADYNRVPRMRHANFYGDANIDYVYGQAVKGLISPVLSTPVAYISSVMIIDPFMEQENLAPVDQRMYTYQDIGTYIDRNPKSQFWKKAVEYYGPWRFGSVGPDKMFSHGMLNSSQLPYDPTNGTMSLGNIWRSQKRVALDMPPIPDLLGEH